MYNINFGKSGMQVPAVAVGCMRISNMSEKEVSAFVDTALETAQTSSTMRIFTAAEKAKRFSEKPFLR